MIQYLKIALMVSLITFFFACGGSDYEEEAAQSSLTGVANGTEACVQTYYNASVIAELKSCGSCHHTLGAANSSNLILPNTDNYSDLSNYQTLKSYVTANPQTFINKIDGTQTHGGSSYGTETITIMQNFADFSRNVSSCVVTEALPVVSPIPISAVTKSSPSQILNLAAKVMLGRPATTTELASVSDETSLDAALDTYMTEDAFYEWIKFSFNDFLFTDKYLDDNDSVILLNNAGYSTAAWYSSESNMTMQDILKSRTNYGITKAPLELIANVVKNDSSFGEILTANYIMVNPFSAKSYGVTTSPDINYVSGDDLDSNASSRDNFVQTTIAGIPHAGILTDTVFLNRIPTTRTNVNRERASKVMRWFLNTDILELANRAISSNDQAETFVNPTLENPNCAVCHKVMDPVTGTFKNWDDVGRFQNASANPLFSAWPATSGPVGFSLNNLMNSSFDNNSLQWLASQIVADPRFARSSVNLFYKALTSRDPLKEPSPTDQEYADKMQAFIFQDAIFRDLSSRFENSGLKAKQLIKELIKSPLFAAKTMTQGSNNEYFGKNIGLAQLITPEQLDKKITKLFGYSWTNRFDNLLGNESGSHHLLESNLYLPLYGGIDSDTITSRPDTFNGVMASIQSRMAIEMGCYSASREFYFTAANRKLLLYVEPGDLSSSQNITTIENIKKTIVHLHRYLLGENVTIDSPQVQKTFALFNTVSRDGVAAITAGDESSNLSFLCDVTTHPDTGADLSGVGIVRSDVNYTIRAWSAVLTYLLSDYKFIYNSNTQ